MKINEEEQNELRELYSKLSTLYKEKAKLEVLKKEREEKLKDEIASVCELKNKKGEVEAKQVKMPLVSAILNELYKDKENKKEIEISTYENYKKAFKDKSINESCIRSYLSSEESLEENTCFIKEAYKESVILSKELLEALNALLKDEFKLHLNDELSKNGYEVKEPKDKEELLELKELIKKLLGQK